MNKIDIRELYEQRLILLVETAPQSNIYYQVIFDKEEFNRLSDSIKNILIVDKIQDVSVIKLFLGSVKFKLPDNIRSHV